MTVSAPYYGDSAVLRTPPPDLPRGRLTLLRGWRRYGGKAWGRSGARVVREGEIGWHVREDEASIEIRPGMRVHFVGIGGSGMSGIAEVLLNLGYRVQGSDLKGSKITERLAGLGAEIFEGQSAANLDGAAVVVISDRDADAGLLVRVIDQARVAGAEKVSLAAMAR